LTTKPTGTVTFLFTDIVNSTRLAGEHPETWDAAQARHHAILYQAIEENHGFVFQVIGDAFCAAFHTVGDAFMAALNAQCRLHTEDWGIMPIQVRMGLHTGAAEMHDHEYRGYLTLVRAQRVMSVAHGRQILVSNASAELIRGELPEDVTLLDLKKHRLKGLLNPEHLWQVVSPDLPREFPPLLSLNDIPNNLPVQLTSFIGREKEMEDLKREVQEHRLVTLTGSGGTGKTRLSLQVAAAVMDMFPDGVWFLELAPVTDPALVANTLANLLGLRESTETSRSTSDLICGYLQSRKVFLIFDNCEHLIEAASRLVDLLLRSCKDVKILASSREALGVEGELAWRLPSLSLPDVKHLPAIDQLSQYEAVQLFIERATLVKPRFSVTKENAPAIAQVCFRLDGIPLAIELAAARANVLTVDQIAKRLDDRFRLLTGGARTALPRQQTLRAMIDWSYNLLSEQERLLFRRLAVFVGGWTLEAAEAVCSGEKIEADQILDLLSQLVHKSLVIVNEENGESRFHRLETIRQYAREKLFETEEATQIRDRHLNYFIEFAEQGYVELSGPQDLLWTERLEAENDNLRTALSWSLESPEVGNKKALQLSGALRDFWDMRGHTREGYDWVRAALEKAPDEPTSDYCRALVGAGLFCIRLSLAKEAAHYLESALHMARQLDIPSSTILSLLYSASFLEDRVAAMRRVEEAIALARAVRNQYLLALAVGIRSLYYADDQEERIRYIKEAQEISQKLGNARLRGLLLFGYARIETTRTNHSSATAMIQEALPISERLKDKHMKAHLLLTLGQLSTQQTRYEEAVRYGEQSLEIFRDLSDRECSTQALLSLGWNAYLSGNASRAMELIEVCLSILRELDVGYINLTPEPLSIRGRLLASQNKLQEARNSYLESLGALRMQEDRHGLVLCLEAVAALPGIAPESAARFLGKAKAVREEEGFTIPTSERHLVAPLEKHLQANLGIAFFESATIDGSKLSYESAIEEASEALRSTM
jgi:predicted ATPase/class 3 adenylate cyclase